MPVYQYWQSPYHLQAVSPYKTGFTALGYTTSALSSHPTYEMHGVESEPWDVAQGVLVL